MLIGILLKLYPTPAFLFYRILFEAYEVLPGQEAQPLNMTWPIVLSLLSVPLLKKPLRPVHAVSLALGFAGVLVISTRGQVFSLRFSHGTGAFMALSSAVIWSLYWIASLRDRREAVVKLLTNFSVGFVCVALYVLVSGTSLRISWGACPGLIWIGLFEMGVTFYIWLKALEYASHPAVVSSFIFLSPFISLFFLHWIGGETIMASSVIGLCLIVTGIVLQRIWERSKLSDRRPKRRGT